MKIRTITTILLIGLFSQTSREQTIPFSFYQMPGYEQSDQAVFTSAINPALLGEVGKISAGIYSEMRYALKDLTHTGGSIGFPVSLGVFGAHILHVGNADFSESAMLIQYAKRLSVQKSYVGVSFGLLQKKDLGYKTLRQYHAAIGLKSSLTESIGYNVVMRIKQMQEMEEAKSMGLDYQLGLSYRFTPQFNGNLQISKEAKRDVQFYVKACYQLHTRTLVSIVCATATQELWAQAVFRLKNMQVGFSVGFHQMMGTTPGCMFMTKD